MPHRHHAGCYDACPTEQEWADLGRPAGLHKLETPIVPATPKRWYDDAQAITLPDETPYRGQATRIQREADQRSSDLRSRIRADWEREQAAAPRWDGSRAASRAWSLPATPPPRFTGRATVVMLVVLGFWLSFVLGFVLGAVGASGPGGGPAGVIPRNAMPPRGDASSVVVHFVSPTPKILEQFAWDR